ncbi:MAG: tetratricopeptide repeat protein [Anaerolineae bacterium]|nr:tetratricopeptide repeat protein [Anaerolineae bacterium]
MRRFACWLVAVFLLLGAGVWLLPYAIAIYHTEQGMALLEESLRRVFPDRLAPEHVLDSERLNEGIAHLWAALKWDPHHRAARLGLARAYAAQNRPELAMEVLQPALERFPRNPLLWLAWGDLQDMRGNAEKAVEAYERGYIGSRSKPLVANYLKLAEAHASLGNGELAIRFWQRVLQLDPGNLYALYHLWRLQRAMGDMTAAAERMSQLRGFRLESIQVPVDLDFRLARAQGIAMTRLVEEGIWDAGTLHRVVRAQVARSSLGLEGLMLTHLLQTLHQHRPEDPYIMRATAEMLQRQGEQEQAEQVYHGVLARESGFADVLLWLGMIAESKSLGADPEMLQHAVRWYHRYRTQVPEDLLGLRRWIEACERLRARGLQEEACEDSAEGHREWKARTDDIEIAADLLKLPKDRLALGPNLLENGGFEDGSATNPVGWSWSDMSNRHPWNAGLFLGGMDELGVYAGRRAARVDGLWVSRDPNREGARAGYWAKKTSLRPGSLYMLSFAYRAQLAPASWVGVWVSPRSEVLFAGDRRLPDTKGAWRRVVIIGKNAAEDGQVAVLLRLWGEGTVLFDEVALRELRGIGEDLAETLSLPIIELR